MRRNDYGFTFGGPVRIPKLYDGRNKTFFFVNFEQFRQGNVNSSSQTTVPTLAYRNGDFTTALCSSVNGVTGACSPFNKVTQNGAQAVDAAGTPIVQGQIFNPYSTHQINGQTVRDPYSNNMIPLSMQDPVALAIQKLLPLPNNGLGDINNYTIPSYASFEHTTNVSFKLDQSLSSTMKISGYYSQLNTLQPNVNGGILPLYSRRYRHESMEPHRSGELRPDHHTDSAVPFGYRLFPDLGAARSPAFRSSTIGLKGYLANQIMPDIAGISGRAGRLRPWLRRDRRYLQRDCVRREAHGQHQPDLDSRQPHL